MPAVVAEMLEAVTFTFAAKEPTFPLDDTSEMEAPDVLSAPLLWVMFPLPSAETVIPLPELPEDMTFAPRLMLPLEPLVVWRSIVDPLTTLLTFRLPPLPIDTFTPVTVPLKLSLLAAPVMFIWLPDESVLKTTAPKLVSLRKMPSAETESPVVAVTVKAFVWMYAELCPIVPLLEISERSFVAIVPVDSVIAPELVTKKLVCDALL